MFERRTSSGSGLFASLGSGFVESLGKIVFIKEKKVRRPHFRLTGVALATAFLSDGRQPEVDRLRHWAVGWLKLSGKSSL